MFFKKKTELGVRYEDGDVLARQGGECSVVHVIQEGQVDVVLETEYGMETIGQLGRGKVIGAVALLSKKPHIATFMANGPVHILSIDHRLFVRRLHEDPSFSYHLLEGFADDIQLLRNEVESLSELDPLTRAYSRSRYEHLVKREIARCDRYGSSLSILLLEVEGFMDFVEAHGGQEGNVLIQQIARVIEGALRISDTLVRWSESRFLVMMPGIVMEQAYDAAGRFIKLVGDETSVVTLAGGVAQYRTEENPMSLARRAVAGLEWAVGEGKGLVRGLDGNDF